MTDAREETEEEELPESLQPFPMPRIHIWRLEALAKIGFEELKKKRDALRQIEDDLAKRNREYKVEDNRFRTSRAVEQPQKAIGLLDGIQLTDGDVRAIIGGYDRLIAEGVESLSYYDTNRRHRCRVIKDDE